MAAQRQIQLHPAVRHRQPQMPSRGFGRLMEYAELGRPG